MAKSHRRVVAMLCPIEVLIKTDQTQKFSIFLFLKLNPVILAQNAMVLQQLEKLPTKKGHKICVLII